MDEPGGIRADKLGYNVLTDPTGVGYTVGKVGLAAQFVASNNDRLYADWNRYNNPYAVTGTYPFTVGAWIKRSSTQGASRFIISRWEDPGVTGRQFVLYTYSDNYVYFAVHNGTSIYSVKCTTFGTISNDTWYFVVGWFVPGTVGVSVNAVSTTATGPSIIRGSDSKDLYIGGRLATYNWDGLIDEAFIYKGRLLTSAEITWLYNTGTGRTFDDLVLGSSNPGGSALYWPLDEESGIRYDKEGYVNLSDNNTVLYSHYGRRNNAANFVAANNEYLSASDGPIVSLGGATPFTIGLWIRPDTINTCWIFSKWKSLDIPNSEYILYISSSYVYVGTSNGGSTMYNQASHAFGTLTAGEWYFVAAYFNPTTNRIAVGVNDIWTDASGPSSIADGNNPLVIGGNTAAGQYFDGLIDEAFIYRQQLLSHQELTWLYNRGYGRTHADLEATPPPASSIEITGDAVSVHVFDSSLEVVGIIDDYYSLVWAERYSIVGDFEMELPISYLSNPIITYGNFLYIPSSDHYMIIEGIKPIRDRDNTTLLVTGESAESLLKTRVIVQGEVNVNGPAEMSIYDLVRDNLLDPVDGDRNIPLLDTTDFPGMLTTQFLEDQFDPKTLYDVVSEIAKSASLGFKFVQIGDYVSPPYKRELSFYVYEGIDRSYAQTDNPWVIFSPKFDNVLTSSVYESNKETVSVVLVISDDTVFDKMYVWKEGVVEPTGFDRREDVLTTTIKREVDGEDDLTDMAVVTILAKRGRELITTNPTKIFEVELNIIGNFRYGEDFFLGDIVQCNISGYEVSARIIEMVQSYSAEGVKLYVALDFTV
jgi:hypothetical protein